MKKNSIKSLGRAVSGILAAAVALQAGLFAPKGSMNGSVSATGIPEDYSEFIGKYENAQKPAREIEINAADFKTNSSHFEVAEFEGKSGAVRRTDGTGALTWEFRVNNEGLYDMSMLYFPTADSVKIGIKLDGEYPFYEMRSYELTRYWHSKTSAIQYDSNNKNQKRPQQVEYDCWVDQTIKDKSGLLGEAYSFRLSSGTHTLTIEGLTPELYLKTITFRNSEELPRYENIKPSQEEIEETPPLMNNEAILVEAELPKYTTSSTLYPTYDRTNCAISPSHPTNKRYNTIGADTWNTPSQTIFYEVEAPYDGYYTLNIKCRQTEALSSSRRIYVNGKVPCAELDRVSIPRVSAWQTISPKTADGEPIYIKLFAGKNTIAFEAVAGDSTGTATEIYSSAARLSSYLNGEDMTDEELAELFAEEADVLSEAAADISGSAAAVSALALAKSLNAAAERPEKLAAMEAGIREQISGLYVQTEELCSQPLEMDYFEIKTVHENFRKSKAGFFKQIDFSFKAFVGSFFEDYAAVSPKTSKNAVNVLADLNAECADALCDITAGGTVRVNIKTPQGSILEAALAGEKADVALFADVKTVAALAERGLTANLRDIYGYNEVAANIPEELLALCGYNGGVYGIPLTQSPQTMFLRTDILERAGLNVPKTWEELCKILPELKRRGAYIGVEGSAGLSEISADSAEVFAETDVTEALRKFRTGEMPIVIISRTEFTEELLKNAPEISGRWKEAALPKNTPFAAETRCLCAVIFKDSVDNMKLDWEFLSWLCDAEVQAEFGKAYEAVSEKLYFSAIKQDNR